MTLAMLMVLVTVNLSRAENPAKSKAIDLVLCLDVSNSMDGLIDSAKLKLWDIVNELAKLKPLPQLRVGLYSYGHNSYPRKNGWVRKDLDLTTDLDEVYAKLNALKTQGGNEYVARVTTAAMKDQKWNEGALKLIFVCGNEPATQDPEITLEAAAGTAKTHDILINTIYCGNADNAEARGWSEFARLCGGKSAIIEQNKARAAIPSTPYDKDLADLSTKLNNTYVWYGKMGKERALNQSVQDGNAAAAAPAAAATRGISKAEALYKNDGWDLVDKLKEDPKFDLTTLKDDELCDEMRKLKADERVAYVKKKSEERADIQKKIAELAVKRQKHLDDFAKNQPKNSNDVALDEALKSIIQEQVTAKGFKIK